MSTLNQLIATANNYQAPDLIGSQTKGMQNELARQELASYPQNQAWQQEQRQTARQKFQWLSEDRIKELEMQPIKDNHEAMKFLLSVGPLISFQNYGKSREWLINKNKIPEFILPPAQNFLDKAQEQGTDPVQLFEKWKNATLMTTDQKLREELGMARLESAERLTGARIDSAEKVAAARQAGMERNQDVRYQSQQEMENLRQTHRKELDTARAEGREGRDLTSKQNQARISVFGLYGLNEFSSFDQNVSPKAGDAIELASNMLSENPEMSPQVAASKAKRLIDGRYESIQDLPQRKKSWTGNDQNRKETVKAIRASLDSGGRTSAILQGLTTKGWAREEAMEVIRDAAKLQ